MALEETHSVILLLLPYVAAIDTDTDSDAGVSMTVEIGQSGLQEGQAEVTARNSGRKTIFGIDQAPPKEASNLLPPCILTPSGAYLYHVEFVWCVIYDLSWSRYPLVPLCAPGWSSGQEAATE